MMTRLAWCAAAILTCHAASAEEICRYSGATSYSGRVAVETTATAANGETTVDATARVAAKSFGLIDWQYLYQEIGTWRDGEIERIGINNRYSVLGSIRRQQWDVFSRTSGGMTAYQAEANSLADFQARHPRFAHHWEPASFGEPWLPDFSTAEPERRADLDLPNTAMPPGLGTPLALGFYWVRWAGPGQHVVPVFLAGFKHETRVDVRVVSVGTDANGLLHLRSSARPPQLSETEISTGDAWVTADHHLVRVTFDGRSDHGSARGELHLDGCQGAAPAP